MDPIMDYFKESSEQEPQPLGLVPLYPLPTLPNSSIPARQKNLFQTHKSGVTLLPPIFKNPYELTYDDFKMNDEAAKVLKEVVAEEILDILQKLFQSEGNFIDEVIKNDVQLEELQQIRVSKSLARELIDEEMSKSCREIILNFLDDMIRDHVNEIDHRLLARDLLAEFEDIFVKEVVNDVLNACFTGEACMLVIHDVIVEETSDVVKEVLMQYGAQLAFSQYKQITKFAAEHVLDGMCLQALLPKSTHEDPSITSVLDHVMFQILLHKNLELDRVSQPQASMPLQWYQKRVIRDVVLDLTLKELEKALDEVVLEST